MKTHKEILKAMVCDAVDGNNTGDANGWHEYEILKFTLSNLIDDFYADKIPKKYLESEPEFKEHGKTIIYRHDGSVISDKYSYPHIKEENYCKTDAPKQQLIFTESTTSKKVTELEQRIEKLERENKKLKLWCMSLNDSLNEKIHHDTTKISFEEFEEYLEKLAKEADDEQE